MNIDISEAPQGSTHLYAAPDLMDQGKPKHYWQWEKHEDGLRFFWAGSEGWQRCYSTTITTRLVRL